MAALAAGPAQAEEPTGASPLVPAAVFVQDGVAEHAHESVFGASWNAHWRRDLDCCVLTSYVEASLGRWSSEGRDASNVWFTQIGITPVLRVQPRAWKSGWYVEGDIGVNLIAPICHSRDKRFSTTFNFGDHLAVGLQFCERKQHEIALRLQHFSNGGIREPNPGENFVQIRYLRHQ